MTRYHLPTGVHLPSFNGRIEITIEPHGPTILFFVGLGTVFRSVPITKRFAGSSIEDVLRWYTRHPDYTISFIPNSAPFTIPRHSL